MIVVAVIFRPMNLNGLCTMFFPFDTWWAGTYFQMRLLGCERILFWCLDQTQTAGVLSMWKWDSVSAYPSSLIHGQLDNSQTQVVSFHSNEQCRLDPCCCPTQQHFPLVAAKPWLSGIHSRSPLRGISQQGTWLLNDTGIGGHRFAAQSHQEPATSDVSPWTNEGHNMMWNSIFNTSELKPNRTRWDLWA